MKRFSLEKQGDGVECLDEAIPKKKIKNQRGFPFNRSYYEYPTPTNSICSYVDATNELVIIFYKYMNSSRCNIYTVDGYLVTICSGKLDTSTIRYVKLYFSARMFVLLVNREPSYTHELIQCNEYTFIRCCIVSRRTDCFDCDQDYIYVSRSYKDKSYIDLYTHDVKLFRTIYSIPGSHIAMKVRDDCVFLLSKGNSFIMSLVQLSLVSGEIIRSFNVPYVSFTYPTFISFHPLGYVIIGYTSTERLDVLYLDEIIRCDDLSSMKTPFAISSMATTVKGDLICASYLGKCIRVYPAV